MEGPSRSCAQCGRELDSEARFCAACGHAAAPSRPHTALAGEEEAATRAFGAGATAPTPAWDGATYPPPAGPAYPPPAGAAYPLPPPRSDTDTAQFPTTWLENVGFSPSWEQAAPPPPAGPPPTVGPPPAAGPSARRPDRPRDYRRLLKAGLFALVAAVIVVPALLVLHSLHAIGGGPAAAQPTAGPRPGASSPRQERAAAASLGALLAHSVTDRGAVSNAVVDVNHCGPALGQDAQTFRRAARSRQVLLRQLAALPGRAALPRPMLQSLTSAWQASMTADQDLARWAQDAASGGCRQGNHSDPNLQASNAPDQQATACKTAFVSQWNPLAARYQLTSYQTSQL